MSFFKKVQKQFDKQAKQVQAVVQKVTPKPLQKPAAKVTGALLQGNMVRSYNQFLVEQSGGDVGEKRAALRRHHFRTFLPFDKTTTRANQADELLKSADPAERARGQALRESVNARTLKHGQVGAAVGALFGGGVAAKAAAGATRGNPSPGEAGHSPFNQAETLPESYEYSPPASMRGQARGAARPSSGLIDVLFRLFVPTGAKKANPVPFENFTQSRAPVSSVVNFSASSPDGARGPVSINRVDFPALSQSPIRTGGHKSIPGQR